MFCPGQKNFVWDKINCVRDFGHQLKVHFYSWEFNLGHVQNFLSGTKIFCPRQFFLSQTNFFCPIQNIFCPCRRTGHKSKLPHQTNFYENALMCSEYICCFLPTHSMTPNPEATVILVSKCEFSKRGIG